MNRTAYWFHLTFWILAFLVWLVVTSANHPTWATRILCTLTLTGASALFACCFTPQAAKTKQIFVSLLAMVGCGVMAAVIIYGMYDWLVGPDPLRFSLASNITIDICIVLLNTIVCFVLATIVAWILGRPAWSLR